jgi:hypothetical protein
MAIQRRNVAPDGSCVEIELQVYRALRRNSTGPAF